MSTKAPRPSSYAASTGSSVLARHLRVSHSIGKDSGIAGDPHQLTLSSTGAVDRHDIMSDRQQAEIFAALVEWIVDSKQSFASVERPSFQRLVHTLCHNYQLPSRRTVVRGIEDEFETWRSRFQDLLTRVKSKFGITIDCWSSRVYRGYIGTTIHWVDGNWKLHSALLGFKYFPPPHNASTTSDLAFLLIESFGVGARLQGVITDSGGQMPNAMKKLRQQLNDASDGHISECWHIRCVCHVLDRAVQDAEECIKPKADRLRCLLKKIRLSNSMRKKFKALQVILGSGSGVDPPGLDCDKDWSSMFTMLEGCYKLRVTFEALCKSHEFSSVLEPLSLSNEDWDILKSMCDFLRIAKRLTEIASSSSFVTISLQPVIFESMKAHCDHTIEGRNATNITTETTKAAANKMKVKLEKYEAYLRGWLPRLALFLVPRTDRAWYNLGDTMEDEVRQLLRSEYGLRSIEEDEVPGSSFVSDAAYISGLLGGDRQSETQDELAQYLQATRSPVILVTMFCCGGKISAPENFPALQDLLEMFLQ